MTIKWCQASVMCTGHGGVPFREILQNMVCAGMIHNCPINLDDNKNTNAIFGPNFPLLKLKMVRLQPKTVVSNYKNILKDILQLYKTVSVAEDIIFSTGWNS